MNKSWKKWLLISIICVVTNFIVVSVIEKLFCNREDWLILAVLWSIAYGVGYFVSKSIENYYQNRWKQFALDLLVTFIAFILLAFVLGVVLNMPNWVYYTTSVAVYFGMSLILNNVFTFD